MSVVFRSLMTAALLASLATPLRAEAEQAKPTFVLVHGAFHGAWAWQRVTPLLNGARVYAPSLAAMGENNHLAAPSVGLDDHIQQIVNLIAFEGLTDVVLVGHSYAGIVITGVANRIPERIARLVYFDAVVPDSGQSFFDAIHFPAAAAGPDWLMPSFPAPAFGVSGDDLGFVSARLTPQPVGTFVEPVVFDAARLANIQKTYIHCLQPWFAFEGFLEFRAKALARGWDYHELNTSHDAMLSLPAETAKLLLQVAKKNQP